MFSHHELMGLFIGHFLVATFCVIEGFDKMFSIMYFDSQICYHRTFFGYLPPRGGGG